VLSALTWLLATPALALSPVDAQAILQIEAQRLPPLALADFVVSEDAETRARAARALGRLRTEGTLAPLKELAADPEADVRVETAFALGQTEGAGSFLLDWWATETDPAVRERICEGLGKQADAGAVPALMVALAEQPAFLHPPRVAERAAVALGRLHMRGIEEASTDEVQRALVRQLRRADRDARRGAAFSLARMARTDPASDVRRSLVAGAKRDADVHVRALLVRALASVEGRDEAVHAVLDHAARDPSIGVRVAAARAAAKRSWTGAVALVEDTDPGVRREAIAAVGRLDHPDVDREALLRPLLEAGGTMDAAEDARLRGDTRLQEAADALTALAGAELIDNLEPYLAADRPTAVRAAAAGSLTDSARRVELATSDAEAAVRTAAAYAWSTDDPQIDEAIALLGSFDDMVAAIAAQWLAENPDPAAENALLTAVADSDEPDLVKAGADALARLYEGTSPMVRSPAESARSTATHAASHPERHAHQAGLALGALLDLPPPPPVHRILTVPLSEVAHVRQARVLTARGSFVIELFPTEAPVTVWNFARLVDEHYFDGLQVHRVVPDFVIQDGDPRGDGNGGPGWSIPDEINLESYRAGTVGMALAGPDTGGSQWFVTVSPQPHLDGGYTVFGRIHSGMETVRRIQPGDRIDRIVIEGRREVAEEEAPEQPTDESTPDAEDAEASEPEEG